MEEDAVDFIFDEQAVTSGNSDIRELLSGETMSPEGAFTWL